jgi:hypothetical protein
LFRRTRIGTASRDPSDLLSRHTLVFHDMPSTTARTGVRPQGRVTGGARDLGMGANIQPPLPGCRKSVLSNGPRCPSARGRFDVRGVFRTANHDFQIRGLGVNIRFHQLAPACILDSRRIASRERSSARGILRPRPERPSRAFGEPSHRRRPPRRPTLVRLNAPRTKGGLCIRSNESSE